MLTGTNLLHTRQYNLRIVLETIRLFGPLSRADVARRTELSVQTVSNLVKELADAGLITSEGEQRRSGPGAPSTQLAIRPDGAWTIGLDLDDHLTGVLVDLAGKVHHRIHVDIDFPTPEHALELMASVVDELIGRQRLKRADIAGVGVGIPGPMRRAPDGSGYLAAPKAFPGWDNVPLAALLQERLGMPILLENNATAAAIGERWYGAGQHISTFFYVYFGSGLGGGLIMNGQPYEGFTGNAGEIGYMPTRIPAETESGETPHVGMHLKLTRLYKRLHEEGADVHTPADLDRLLSAEDPALLAWMDQAASDLAALVQSVEYLIDPEAIFFGGRLPDPVIAALMERIAERLPPRPARGPTGRPAYLLATSGADAAALGVATLPIYQVFAPAPGHLLKTARAGRGTFTSPLVIAGG